MDLEKKRNIIIEGLDEFSKKFKELPLLYRIILTTKLKSLKEFEIDELAKILKDTAERLNSEK